MASKITLDLIDDGNIVVDFTGLALHSIRAILKVSVAFAREATGYDCKRYRVSTFDNVANIWMPEYLHISECEAFCDALRECLILYAKLSSIDLEIK